MTPSIATKAALATALVACSQHHQNVPPSPQPIWRCYALDHDTAHADLLPSSIVLGANSRSPGQYVATVQFADSGTAISTRFASWRKDGQDSVTVFWPVRGPGFMEVMILTARLTGDSLYGDAAPYVDMGRMSDLFPVRGHVSCKAGA
jgi:hypothetical protein